ncbi:MAG: MurR/RpiR family transcriptional regulator [Clostridia bacterium]
MEYTFFYEVRKKYKQLRPSEQKVADAILNPDVNVLSMTIEELAKISQVSQPTIIRFANALGLKGFKEIKNRLMREQMKREQQTELAKVVSFPISPTDKLVDTPIKVIKTHIKHLEDMLKNLSSYELIKAIDSIIKAKRIIVFAVENSSCVADDLKTKLLYMGFDVVYNSDPYLQTVSAKNMTSDDLAIGISYTGTSKITVDALYSAKQSGATTIAITNFEKALINKYADVILCTGSEQYLYGNAIFSRCTQLALIDMLYTGILTTNYEEYSGKIEYNSEQIRAFAYKE